MVESEHGLLRLELVTDSITVPFAMAYLDNNAQGGVYNAPSIKR